MMIMPTNNTGFITGYLYGKYPDKIGLLISPDGWRIPQFKMPYALDNGCFKKWDKEGFFHMLRKASMIHKPLWVCVPDAVADAGTTLRRWAKYHKQISSFGFKLAFVVQDGMTPEDVPPEAYACFIGGSTEFKLKSAHLFKNAKNTRWLHIGRVNSEERVMWALSIGADSVDGTGWLRARDKKRKFFIEYFEGKEQMEWAI